MRASKADKFYMGMLLAIICFCFGLLRIMDEADARRAAERETPIIAEPPTIVAPAFQPVQTVYFEPDPEPEEPAAEVFVFRENVPLSAELQEVLWDACQEHKVEYALALGLIETESSFNPEAVSYAIKSVLENLSKNNHWPDKPDPIAPAAEEETADQPSNDL